LLAVLLLHGGDVVSRDRLVDALWGGEPPRSAVQSLQVYVHGLRQVLGADRIETHGTGYRLRLDGGELDFEQFERLLEAAGRALAAERPGRRRRTSASPSASGSARRWRTSRPSRSRRPRLRAWRNAVSARSSS
jgi:DNA-binding SARP family transcriptional activator